MILPAAFVLLGVLAALSVLSVCYLLSLHGWVCLGQETQNEVIGNIKIRTLRK